MEIERHFSKDPVSVRRAREFVAEMLSGSGSEADLDLIRLLTSELATNAVLHAKGGYRVRVELAPESVRVEIVNSEPELLLAMREPSETGGRGLQLLDRLSADWGVESRRDEKVVWFEVPRQAARRYDVGR